MLGLFPLDSQRHLKTETIRSLPKVIELDMAEMEYMAIGYPLGHQVLSCVFTKEPTKPHLLMPQGWFCSSHNPFLYVARVDFNPSGGGRPGSPVASSPAMIRG